MFLNVVAMELNILISYDNDVTAKQKLLSLLLLAMIMINTSKSKSAVYIQQTSLFWSVLNNVQYELQSVRSYGTPN